MPCWAPKTDISWAGISSLSFNIKGLKCSLIQACQTVPCLEARRDWCTKAAANVCKSCKPNVIVPKLVGTPQKKAEGDRMSKHVQSKRNSVWYSLRTRVPQLVGVEVVKWLTDLSTNFRKTCLPDPVIISHSILHKTFLFSQLKDPEISTCSWLGVLGGRGRRGGVLGLLCFPLQHYSFWEGEAKMEACCCFSWAAEGSCPSFVSTCRILGCHDHTVSAILRVTPFRMPIFGFLLRWFSRDHFTEHLSGGSPSLSFGL